MDDWPEVVSNRPDLTIKSLKSQFKIISKKLKQTLNLQLNKFHSLPKQSLQEKMLKMHEKEETMKDHNEQQLVDQRQ